MRSLWRRWLSSLCGVVMGVATVLVFVRNARAIDFYEIQIYDTDTAPMGHLELELHSNSVTTATGEQAKSAMDVYQVHETVEATFGVLRWLEIGQYFCTAKFSADGYQYSGSRSKIHFSIPQTFD